MRHSYAIPDATGRRNTVCRSAKPVLGTTPEFSHQMALVSPKAVRRGPPVEMQVARESSVGENINKSFTIFCASSLPNHYILCMQ